MNYMADEEVLADTLHAMINCFTVSCSWTRESRIGGPG